MWFTEFSYKGSRLADKVFRFEPGSHATHYHVGYGPMTIVTGPDGALWFTEVQGDIARLTTGGTLTQYPVPGGSSSRLGGIAVGSDGALWFTENAAIGRINTGGKMTSFPIPGSANPVAITAGNDGGMWFTYNTSGTAGIGRIEI